jgi:hypothetical protein
MKMQQTTDTFDGKKQILVSGTIRTEQKNKAYTNMFPQQTEAIQGVSRLVDITAGGDFLGLCDQKSSYKHVSNFGRLRSYGLFLIPVYALV